MFPYAQASLPYNHALGLLAITWMWQCKQNYPLEVDLTYPLAIFLFRMEFTLNFEAYEHAQCVQMFGCKCYICSVEAKDQVGLETQHIVDGVVYTDGIDGSKWVFCNKCKKTYHLNCVCPDKKEPTKWPFLCSFNECK